MKKIFSGVLLMTISLVAFAAGITWVDLESSVYQPQFRNWAWYSDKDSQGTLYLSGWATSLDPANRESHWIVKKSQDNGSTWRVILDEKFFAARAFSPSVNNSGTLITAAEVIDTATSPHRWAIRKSHDGGQTWENLDAEPLAPGKDATVYFSKILDDGTILASGSATDAQDVVHWRILRREAGQASWEVVDDMPASHFGADAAAAPILYNPTTKQLLVAGWWDDASGRQSWVVKRSLDQGKTWGIVDIYQGVASDSYSFPYQIFLDTKGNPYILGETSNSSGVMNCVLRHIDPQTKLWTNLDYSTGPNGGDCGYLGGYFQGDTLYVTGTYIDVVDGPWGKYLRKGFVKRTSDLGKSWEVLQEIDLGPYGHGTQYNSVTANSLGEILVFGTYVHQPEGDEWVVKKLGQSP